MTPPFTQAPIAGLLRRMLHADFSRSRSAARRVHATLIGVTRGGVAIGDDIFDLAAALELGLLFDGPAAHAARAASGTTAQTRWSRSAHATRRTWPAAQWSAGLLRRQTRTNLPPLRGAELAPHSLAPRHAAMSCLPMIGDYTDSAGITFATNAGKLFRPDNPAAAELQIRADRLSRPRVVDQAVDGAEVRRPNGQRKPRRGRFRASGSLATSTMVELGVWIGARTRRRSDSVAEAASHIAGFCLLNDWSARDIQGWEYQPLRPFLGKSFPPPSALGGHSRSAGTVPNLASGAASRRSASAIAIFLDPPDRATGALDIDLEVLLPRMASRSDSLRRAGFLPAAHAISIGPSPSWSPITPAAADKPAGRATSLGPASISGTCSDGLVASPGDFLPGGGNHCAGIR